MWLLHFSPLHPTLNVRVFNIREVYTTDIYYRISWAIIDDGWSFFSQVMKL